MASLTVERALPASRERVWSAFAEPAELAAWFWPPRMQTEARIDAAEGGEVRIRSEVADLGLSGRVTEAEAPRLLAFTWRWDGEDDETHATLRLTADGDATLLTVEHDGFADPDAVADHVAGWNDCLDRLSARLTSRM
jgi:uncharacterized protein YndB with AHSA1/START domain